MRHELKVQPPYFDHLLEGKNFEVRKNDRGFQKGDTLHLYEWEPAKGIGIPARTTGRKVTCVITHVFAGGFGLDLHGWVVLGLDCPVSTPEPKP